MHPLRPTLAAALAAVTVVASGVASAMPIQNLPPEETQGAVTYRTGGIGDEEATAMRRAEASYPLSLEFAGRSKPRHWFLANVEVANKDHRADTLRKTYSDGPCSLLRRLPETNDEVWTVRRTR